MVIYESIVEAAQGLPPEEQGSFYKAIIDFTEFGREPEGLGTTASILFTALRPGFQKQRAKLEGARRKAEKEAEDRQMLALAVSASGKVDVTKGHSSRSLNDKPELEPESLKPQLENSRSQRVTPLDAKKGDHHKSQEGVSHIREDKIREDKISPNQYTTDTPESSSPRTLGRGMGEPVCKPDAAKPEHEAGPKPRTVAQKPPTEAEALGYMRTAFAQKARSESPWDARLDLHDEAEQFVLFYSSKGWKVGRNPMTNWHAAASQWLSRSSKRLAERDPAPKHSKTKEAADGRFAQYGAVAEVW